MFTRRLFAALLILGVVSPVWASTFDKAEYFKKAGQKKIKGSLVIDEGQVLFVPKGGKDRLVVPAASIKNVLYEVTAKPRYAAGLLVAWPLLFTKSKKHFVTIQYIDEAGAGQYALIRLDKSNAREVLAELEARTGRKIERSQEQ